MERKFKTLRLFAVIQIIVGALLLVAAAIALLVLVGVKSTLDDRVASFIASAYGVIAIVGLVMAGIASIAYGQFLQVVMQIEENTRKE